MKHNGKKEHNAVLHTNLLLTDLCSMYLDSPSLMWTPGEDFKGESLARLA